MIVFSIVLFIMFVVYVLHDIRMIKTNNLRFLEVPTRLQINPPSDIESDDYEDELLMRLTKGSEKPQSKLVTIVTTIDLEEVCGFDQWTSSKYEDDKVFADCVYVRFHNGDAIVAYLEYSIFEEWFNNYLRMKTRYL